MEHKLVESINGYEIMGFSRCGEIEHYTIFTGGGCYVAFTTIEGARMWAQHQPTKVKIHPRKLSKR